MSRHERVIQPSTNLNLVQPSDLTKRLVPQSKGVIPLFDIPLEWCYMKPDEDMDYNSEDPVAGGLNEPDLPVIGTQLFKGNSLPFFRTLKSIGHEIDQTTQARGWQQQFGHYAYIFMYEVSSSGKTDYFTTYISRYPEGTQPAEEAIMEYHELQKLADRFEKHLKPEFKQKYGVVKPIDAGTLIHNGQAFPLFTMPFIPLGELKVSTIEVLTQGYNLTEATPYLSYAIPYNQQMRDTHNRQGDIALELTKARLAQNEDYILQKKSQDLIKQWDDYLTGNILIYVLSGQKFPRKHQINAGDWMARINNDSLNLRLIALRGGLTGEIPLVDFVVHLVNQIEPIYKKIVDKDGNEHEIGYDLKPLKSTYSSIDILRLINKAASLIDY